MSYFIQHLPPQCHLTVISRAEPNFSLSRLRVRAEPTEIRSDDLRFSPTETQQFFHHTLEVDLSNDLTQKIEQRTEGWVAGLQLASLAMQRTTDVEAFISTFSGSNRYVMDYLTDEVLY